MLLSICALKSLNSIGKTQPKIMCATFKENLFIKIISCYSPTNQSSRLSQPSRAGYLPFPSHFTLRLAVLSKHGSGRVCSLSGGSRLRCALTGIFKPQGGVPTGSNSHWRGWVYRLAPKANLFSGMPTRPRHFWSRRERLG